MPEMQREGREVKLTYADNSHAYYLDGKRATSVTSVAKIPIDRFGSISGINAWSPPEWPSNPT